MISKRIGIAPQNDNYARLANYIADAGDKGEKLLLRWCTGCEEEDYANGIGEVRDTQSLNSRVKTAKTYHLIVSFRREDEGKLTPEAFREMEERFAAVLGYSAHQRHCGVHRNTGNVHMHVAYNMIHPERRTWHKEFRDFHARDRLCRELEREYGLSRDRGREQGKERRALGDRAALAEAHSGQESFESYARRHTKDILAVVDAAHGWQELHTALARFGMEIKAHGNGLAIKDRHGKHAVKASAVDRSLSMKKLEARFGPYRPAQGLEHIQEQSRYQAAPLHRAPQRGNLFVEYWQGIAERKVRLEAVKEREDTTLAAIRVQWAARRKEIERMGIAKKNRRTLLSIARKHEAEAIAGARLAMQPDREAVRRDMPFTDWNGFLRCKAEQGSETALAILRSRRESVAEEREAQPQNTWMRHSSERYSTVRPDNAARERAVLELDGVSGKGKKRLLAVLRMERLAAEEAGLVSGFQHTVDNKGAVIFTLTGGGVIRDQGSELFYSSGHEAAKKTALLYARAKWGKAVTLEGNRIARKLEPAKEHVKGVER